MIRAVVRWMRQVLPPDWMVGTVFAVYGFSILPYWLELWRNGINADSRTLMVRDAVLWFVAAGYGVYRISGLHPLMRPDYHAWLAATPWTRNKPLPLGPIHLVLQDVVVMAALWCLMHLPQTPRLLLFLMFLSTYLAMLALSLALADRPWSAYLMMFGLGLAVLVAHLPLPCGLVLAAVYLVGYGSLRRSLGDFPWPRAEKMIEAKERFSRGFTQNQQQQDALGWPYDHISPKVSEASITYRHAIGISLLVGWWTFVLAARLPRHVMPQLMGMLIIPTLFGCLFGRLGLYTSHRRSPINFWGRLWTFRWIIPSHDKVFIAPLCVPLALSLCGWATFDLKWPPPVGFALAESSMLLITLAFGPRLAAWQLTSKHRIKPALSSAATKELVKI